MSAVSPGALVIFSFRYLPRPSWVMPRWTLTPSFGTSENLNVLFWPEKIAAERSFPTFSESMSKAAVNSMSRTWYPPRSTCIRPGTCSAGSASL